MLLETGDTSDNLKNQYFYQLNLNTKDKLIPYGEDIIVSFGLKTKSIYLNHKYTVLKYLEFYRNLYYTKNENLSEEEIWLAALTATTFSELNEMLSHILSNHEKNKLIGDVIRMSKDYFSIHEWEKEKCDELVKSESRRIDREEGIQEGIEQTIKKMLEKKLDKNLISEITSKSIEEIEQIETKLK